MRILWRMTTIVVATVILAFTAILTARWGLLPPTTCTVTKRAVDDLRLEIDYGHVRDALGCDGVLAAREVWSRELKREVYHWRGDAWPFGRFEGLFYNGVLHGKDVRWITFNVGLTPDTPSSEH